MTADSAPFELLLRMEQRCRRNAAALPSPQEVAQTWSGIGFRLGQNLHAAPMGEVAEILHPLPYTGLPGVKPWVKGVANLRGRLLPLLDLCGFFGLPPSTLRKQQRILVVEQGESFIGLLVDEVFGMQHFALDSFEQGELAPLADTMRPFVHGLFRREQPWFVFSPHALMMDAAFADVAA